ncbi:MAG: YkgJ family cysteine cluster protein [Euryarchaeota archaeon]|nr:YkgJ family cysteine cluster protein [Euryarchaeota archaeon]
MSTDLSELDGKGFRCLDGCALCCLCQPELSPAELRALSKSPRARDALTAESLDGRKASRPSFVKLQGGAGACFFLEGRRCSVYDIRPRCCRQFPVHVHVMERAQLSADLSCRGISEGGSALRAIGEGILAAIPNGIVTKELARTSHRWSAFEEECKAEGVYRDGKSLRTVVSQLLPSLKSEGGLARLMAFLDAEPDLGKADARDLAASVECCDAEIGLDKIANGDNYELLSVDEIPWLPVYIDERLGWKVLRAREGAIEVLALQEGGTIEERARIPLGKMKLLAMRAPARKVLSDYAAILNRRDHTLGHAAHVCAEGGFSSDLMAIYLGVVATALLDLWWRASLIGILDGKNEIEERLAREGIIALDMDMQDAPTMGAFV